MNYFLNFRFNYDLIDKRKPTAGVGWMERIMLDHNEKFKLVLELIQAGAKDPDLIIHTIQEIEKKLFPKT